MSDVGLGGLLKTLERYQYADISYPINFQEITFVTSYPKMVVPLDTVLRPASLSVWLLTLSTTAVVIVVLAVIDGAYGSITDYIFIDSMAVYGALLQSNVPFRWIELRSFKARSILFLFWICLSMFITMAYR